MKKESIEMLETLFGDHNKTFVFSMEKSQPEFAKIVDEVALQRFWSRKGLPLREKSLITFSSQAALGRCDQVEIHMKSFLRLGGLKTEVSEVLFHLALYTGFPTAIAGFKVLETL